MESEEIKPSLYIDSKYLPNIESWKVGGEYDVVAKLKQTSMSMRQENGKDKKMSANFEIKMIKPIKHQKNETMKNAMVAALRKKMGKGDEDASYE